MTAPRPVPTPGLDALPPTRRALLVQLKTRGEAAAQALAQVLGITPSAVRQHLGALEAEGLLLARDQPDGPGRPRRLYRLSPRADTLFPRAYAELTNELLSYLQDARPELLPALFERRAERRLAATLARTAGLSFAAQVQELARILDEDGYLASVEAQPDGSYTVTEHNCAVLGVALHFGHACSSELAYLKAALPGARVTRVAHLLSGQHVCAYRIEPLATPVLESALD